ncbi:MAG: cyclic nucleotide-binding domain-containing protein [Methylocystaceae bacterium]|nr:cyclic nucleotide-binding domain-containing protein [Methylocystaceae bacterium]
MSSQPYSVIRFNKNTPLFKEGEKADCAYIIKKGSVKISKRGPSGKNISIATASKGGIVGEMAVVSDNPRSATVIAVEPVEAIAVSKESFDRRLEGVDPFLHSLITTVINRLRKTSDHTVALYEKIQATQDSELKSPYITKKAKINKNGFSKINFLLADPNRQTRNGLRSSLFGHGFREICDISNHFKIAEEMTRKHYDLAILDAAFGLKELNGIIQDIRHAKASKNPFVTILVMTESQDKEVHQTLRHAGCDEILIKPLSLMDIINKIEEISQNGARTFVVTRDYAGPDRTGFKGDDAKEAPQFSPPNTFVAKLTRNISEERVETAVQKAVLKFNAMKIERHMVQINWLIQKLDPTNGEPIDRFYLLDRINEVLDDLTERSKENQFDGSIKSCKDMRALINDLKSNDNFDLQSWQQLGMSQNNLQKSLPSTV